jgi:uncharacterized protein
MLSLGIAVTLAAAVLATSFVSGIFGMAGGMILLGILLALMPVAAAMVLHGLTQMVANGWRAWLWGGHILWPVVGRYSAGALAAMLVVAAAGVAVDKPLTLLALALMSFTGLLLPGWLAPRITGRGQAVCCGGLCTLFQLVAGVAGPIFDVFFVRAGLERRQVVATKAAIQVIGHALKVLYFVRLTPEAGVAPLAIALAMLLAPVGTQLSRYVLEALSEQQFRTWSRGLIAAVATVYLVEALLLLAPGQPTSAHSRFREASIVGTIQAAPRRV